MLSSNNMMAHTASHAATTRAVQEIMIRMKVSVEGKYVDPENLANELGRARGMVP